MTRTPRFTGVWKRGFTSSQRLASHSVSPTNGGSTTATPISCPLGLDEQIDIATIGGGTRQETWTYPGASDCRFCHNGNASYILGVKPWQLNGDFTYPLTGRTANQLETLGALGWFDNSYRADLIPWLLQSHNVAETQANLTDRVRSYLDSNCSQCHQPGGVRAFFDARITTPLAQQGLIFGDVETNYGDDLNRVIRPGDPDRSILLRRMGSVAEIKMPPIAKHIVDQPAIQLVTDWINSLGTGPLVTLTGPLSTFPGSFEINVHFTQAVTGLSSADFNLLGGTATSLTGSGADYVLTVNTANLTRVSITLPAGSAQNAGDAGNYASAPYLQTVTEPQPAQPASLLAWYHLDETSGSVARDTAGSSVNNGTLAGTTLPAWSAAKFDGGLTFNGAGRVEVPNSVGNDFTISFWMKSNQVFPRSDSAASGSALVFADMPGNAADFLISGTKSSTASGSKYRISVMTGTPTAAATQIHGTSSVNNNQWNHIAVTRAKASGEVKIYVNGALERTAVGTTATLNANPIISLGANPGATATSYNGSLDEIQFYNRVLAQAEVTSLLNGPPPPQPATLEAPSLAYDAWTQAWFPGLTHLQGPQTAELDFDRDGITNFGEFAFGASPMASDFVTVPIRQDTSTGAMFVSYAALKDKSASRYKLMVSSDMLRWTDAAAGIIASSAVPIAGTDYETVTVTYQPPAGTGGKQFFSIQASQQ